MGISDQRSFHRHDVFTYVCWSLCLVWFKPKLKWQVNLKLNPPFLDYSTGLLSFKVYFAKLFYHHFVLVSRSAKFCHT